MSRRERDVLCLATAAVLLVISMLPPPSGPSSSSTLSFVASASPAKATNGPVIAYVAASVSVAFSAVGVGQTPGIPVGPGDLIVAFIATNGTVAPTAVSDTASNTYASTTAETRTTEGLFTYYSVNARAGPSVGFRVTFALPTTFVLTVVDISGVSNSPIDVTMGGTSHSLANNFQGFVVSTASPDELILAGDACGSSGAVTVATDGYGQSVVNETRQTTNTGTVTAEIAAGVGTDKVGFTTTTTCNEARTVLAVKSGAPSTLGPEIPYVAGSILNGFSAVASGTTAGIRVLAGETLVAFVATNGTVAPKTVSDSAGDHFTTLPSEQATTEGLFSYYSANAAAHSGVSFVATFAEATIFTISFVAVAGVATVAPIDADAGGSAHSSAGSTQTSSVTTTSPDDLVLAGDACGGGGGVSTQATGQGPALVNQTVKPTNTGTVEEEVALGPGVIRGAFTTTATCNEARMVVALAPAAVPAAPSGLVAGPISSTSITLSWVNPSGPILNDSVYYETGCAGAFVRVNIGAVVTSYTLGGLTSNTTYCVYVVAWGGAGTSPPSAELQTATRSTSTYPITFSEGPLPAGVDWSVTLNGVLGSNATPGSISFRVANGSYSYSIPYVNGYRPIPINGTVAVSGSAVSVPVVFAPPPAYGITFTETGLALGSNWSVVLNGSAQFSTASRIAFLEPNGTYTYAITQLRGYISTPVTGTIPVAGGPVNVSVAFTLAKDYPVTFSETGLAAGLTWSLDLGMLTNGSTAPSPIGFLVANGTYSYEVGPTSGYGPSPMGGNVTVAGAAVAVTIDFSKYFGVTFSESGLPTGTPWDATLGALSNESNAPSTLGFQVFNGVYGYAVGTIPGYVTSPSQGQVTVSGHSQTLKFKFSKLSMRYSVTFTESGLGPGTMWNVTFSGAAQSAVAPAPISFLVANGTYPYTVPVVPGPPEWYSGSPSAQNETVKGAPITVSLQFTELYRAPAGSLIQHVVVIMLENQEVTNIWKSGPYQNYLLNTYGNASNFYSTCHSSTSLYMAVTSGSTFNCNVTGPVSVPNIADLFNANNLTWMGYMEGMPTACDRSNVGTYLEYHDPFVYYDDIISNKTYCAAHVVNSAQFNQSLAAGILPNFAFYVPNYFDDGHGPSNKYFNATVGMPYIESWLKGFLPPILNHTGNYSSPATQALVDHTEFILMYDEGTTNRGYTVDGIYTNGCTFYHYSSVPVTACGGHIGVTFINPLYSVHTIDSAQATTYSVTSTIEWLFSLHSTGGWDGSQYFPAMTTLFSFGTNGYSSTSIAPPEPSLGSDRATGCFAMSPCDPLVIGLVATGTLGLLGIVFHYGRRRSKLSHTSVSDRSEDAYPKFPARRSDAPDGLLK